MLKKNLTPPFQTKCPVVYNLTTKYKKKKKKNVYTVHENIFIRLQTNKLISVSFQFSGECNVSYAATPLIAMKTRLKYL